MSGKQDLEIFSFQLISNVNLSMTTVTGKSAAKMKHFFGIGPMLKGWQKKD